VAQLDSRQIDRVLQNLRGSRGQVMGGGTGSPFRILSPAGSTVWNDRPAFRWTSLPEATGYQVTITRADGSPIAVSPAGLQKTEWVPNHPLPRGTLLKWVVSATLPEGTMPSLLFAPGNEEPQARFRILPARDARKYTVSLFNLGAQLLQDGFLDQARDALDTVILSDPDSRSAKEAQKLLDRLK
jgi:hypothetical protein